MRRSLLNKQILPKPLRQALVLITLLLLPSAAWGQTEDTADFEWVVQGTASTKIENGGEYPVNALNAQGYSCPLYIKDGNLASTENRSVTYASSDENVATINSEGVVTIKAIGNTTITGTLSDNATYTYPDGSKTCSYTLKVSFPAPGFSCFSGDDGTKINIYFEETPQTSTTIKYKWDNNPDNSFDAAIPFQAGTLTAWGVVKNSNNEEIKGSEATITYYGLILGLTPLSNENVGTDGSVTIEGVEGVSFTAPSTLLFENGSINTDYSGIEWIGDGELKIQYSGTNFIKPVKNDDITDANLGYGILGSGSSTLTLTGANKSSTLTLGPCNGSRKAIYGFSTINYGQTGTDVWEMYYTDNFKPVTDAKSLDAGREVVITKGYLGIAVAGVPVTSSNANEITGDHISGSVSFDSEEKILTLNGATIDLSDNNGYPVVSSIENLTVKLIGKNEATLYTDCPNFIKYSGESSSAQLTFETEWSSDENGLYSLGDLTINNAESSDNIANGYSISNSLAQSDSYIDPHKAGQETSSWRFSTINNQSVTSVKVWYLKVYDLWIGSGRVISTNLEAGQSGGFKYDPVKELLPATSTNNYPIKSSMEELVISVKGPNCGITPSSSTCAITFQSTDEQLSGKLKFVVAEGAEENMNKFTIRNDGGAISGFSSVTFEDPLKLNTPATTPTTWDASTTNVVISDEIFYDLWVMGQQVTSANASDIFGAAQSSQTVPAIFDAEESTLTLNGLQLSNSTTYPTCIESGLESLTVTLSGDNKFQKGGDVTTLYGFKAQDGKTCNITFEASGSFSFMVQTEPEYAVSGFNKVTYKDDLVAYMSEGNFYISEDIYLNFNTVYDNDYPTGVRIITSGLNADIVSHKIAYTIDYAKEDMEDVPETEYTGVIPLATITAGPCTVTAYTLSLDGENTKSNNIKGCYFQYTESEVIIGNGSTIDLMDYLLPALAGEEEVSFDNTSSQSGTIISISEEDNTITGIAYGTASVISTVGGEFTTFNQTLEPDEFTLSISITVQDIIGESTFASGQSYGTFYNTDQAYKVPEGVLKAYIIKSVDEEKGEIVTEETSVLPPSTPVLLFRTSTSGSANYVFTKVSGVEPANTELKYTTTEKEAVETSKLYVLYNGQFVKVTANTMIPANHCYLDLATTAGTRGFYNIGDGEGTTAIREVKSEGVNSEKLADGAWHDLQGRKFTTKPTKAGIYIRNGKKIVIK